MSPVGGSALYASASGSGSLSRLPVKSNLLLVKALATSASLYPSYLEFTLNCQTEKHPSSGNNSDLPFMFPLL